MCIIVKTIRSKRAKTHRTNPWVIERSFSFPGYCSMHQTCQTQSINWAKLYWTVYYAYKNVSKKILKKFLILFITNRTGTIKCIIIHDLNYKSAITQQSYKTCDMSKVHTQQNLNLNTRWLSNDWIRCWKFKGHAYLR